MFFLRAFFVFLLLIGVAHSARAETETAKKPQRIASLGLCTDQILLMMVDASRIATVNHQAADPVASYMAKAVGSIPLNYGSAEEIIPLHPDLVISTSFGAPDAVRILKKLGYRVELMPLPTSVDGIRSMLLRVGQWLGETEKAKTLIAEMDKKIADAQARNQHKPSPRAIIYSPNGYTIGSDTLENDILRQAGYRNLAADMGMQRFQQISLETLVTTQPDRILIDNYAYNPHSLAYSYINHPVVRQMIPFENRMYVPSQLRDCAGPQVADEIAWLADHR
ncbi:MAG: ABC transporter substrate-binding protein [Pseudomonadales bacterium]|jgi:iron complex transport system substrate-binding protein|nr:ABC transporter substrate-binding protein [Pseudomonadales bacterium]